jgi:TatD DNase family protein
MTKYIDSHAHITSAQLLNDCDAILERAQEAQLEAIVNICTDAASLEAGLKLAKRYPWVYNTAATTPHDVEKEGEALFSMMADAARSGELVAVGETGLDYHYEHSPRDLQKEFLRRYLKLALECELPVVIHCRDAFADFFDIIDSDYRQGEGYAPGVLHCFTGTVEEASEVIKRGWYLSLSGIVTFKKSDELREVAKMTPLEQLLIETDSPYLAPQSKRGKQNEPSYLPEVAQCIATAKGIDVDAVSEATNINAKKLFKLNSLVS